MRAYIALGANLGDARRAFALALKKMGQLPETRLLAVSSLYQTEPIDATGPDYSNAVCTLETTLGAHELLNSLQLIENEAGRVRPVGVYHAPRTLDLDLLLYGNEVIRSEDLIVPHPRLCERAFVLVPLLEIAPAIEIPGKGEATRFLAGVQNQRILKMKD